MPHGCEEVARTARAVGVLVAVFFLVAGALLDADAIPVGFHFIGDHDRQAGAHPLAHFGAQGHDGDDAVGADADEDGGVVDGAAGEPVGAVFTGVGREDIAGPAADQDQAGGRADGLEQGAALRGPREYFIHDTGIRAHQTALLSSCDSSALALAGCAALTPAACLMAARMRVYVPQRQILPLMALSMSASLGEGVFFKSAVADMICPAWQ
jgi:hypothetical protein